MNLVKLVSSLPNKKQRRCTLKTEKFGFIVHPLCYEDLRKLPIVQQAEAQKWSVDKIEQLASHMPPVPYGDIRNIESAHGTALGIFYAVTATTDMILSHSPQSLYWKLILAANYAALRGCSVVGLGAYTSVCGDGGITVSDWSPIPVTTGNGYTVVSVLQTIHTICRNCNIRLENLKVLIVGATGSIGSACARLLAGQVGGLTLLSSDASWETLNLLANEIGATPRSDLDEEIAKAHLIVTATSSNQPLIDGAKLQPGAIVCDVARPFDVFSSARNDILVVASGEVLLPGSDVVISSDIGLPRVGGRVYACLAETALLALTQQYQYVTLGKTIDIKSVDSLRILGEAHGFQLAPLDGPQGIISEQQFAKISSFY